MFDILFHEPVSIMWALDTVEEATMYIWYICAYKNMTLDTYNLCKYLYIWYKYGDPGLLIKFVIWQHVSVYNGRGTGLHF